MKTSNLAQPLGWSTKAPGIREDWLLAVDPGACAGYAIFLNGQLTLCGVEPTRETLSCWEDHTLVIEKPVIYPKSPVPPNDVVRLAIRMGEVKGMVNAAKVIETEPRAWKGNVPKEIHHARIWAKLSALEKSQVDVAGSKMAPGKRHNMMDAIGLGLWALKR